MYIPLEFIELTELVDECNKLRNVLQKIKEITGGVHVVRRHDARAR